METRPVYVAWTNSDLTEGRGRSYPLCICESESTAIRLGAGKSVQGSNAYVTEEIAICHESKWYVPGMIQRPSKGDAAKDEMSASKNAVVEKARLAGLTEDDISILVKG